MDRKTITEVMRVMGSKGGKASGKARMTKMTPEQRSAVARMAAKKSAEVRSEKAAKEHKATAKKVILNKVMSRVENG